MSDNSKINNLKILIVGGGVAGMSAAMELSKQNHEVSLYESAGKLGGRINSRIDKTTGDSIDNGQHLLIGAYTRFIEMLKVVGADNELYIQDDFKIKYYYKNGKKVTLDGSGNLGDLSLLIGLLKLPFSFPKKLKTIIFIGKIKLGIISGFGQTTAELLSSQPREIIELFWEPLVLATINTDLQNASAELLINVLKQGFFAGGDNKKLIFPKKGLTDLIIPIQEFLDEKINLSLKTTVRSIDYSKEKVKVLSSNGKEEFDKVILALPLRVIKNLIPEYDNYDQKLRASSIISVYLWFDKKFFPDDFAAFIGTKIQWVFNKRKLGFDHGKNDYPEYLTVTISASDNLLNESPNRILEMILSELNEIFPESKGSKLHHSKIIKERNATFYASAENQELRKSVPKSINDKIYFAGDWSYLDFPATIEAAARSGVEASKLIG